MAGRGAKHAYEAAWLRAIGAFGAGGLPTLGCYYQKPDNARSSALGRAALCGVRHETRRTKRV